VITISYRIEVWRCDADCRNSYFLCWKTQDQSRAYPFVAAERRSSCAYGHVDEFENLRNKGFPIRFGNTNNGSQIRRDMSCPAVTVLIPAYNAVRTIERALASVHRQNYPEMEIIVVDDGSTDGTAARIQEMGCGNIRLIRLEKNRGVSAAMNAGIQGARTDYIAFLDADDEWLGNKLTTQLPIIESRSEMSFIACGGESVNENGVVYRTFGLDPPSCSPREFWRALLRKSYVAKPTVVARRAKVLEVGGFTEAFEVSEDQDMWIRLALNGEVGFITQVLVRVHDTPKSLMKRHQAREDEIVLPMIRNHLRRLSSRLSKREMKTILGERFAATGRNIYPVRPGRGAALVFRAMLLGNRPLQNLGYLMLAAPPVITFKTQFRQWSRSH
jgi:glycosyltransferase involved in cell wall biosynthesis